MQRLSLKTTSNQVDKIKLSQYDESFLSILLVKNDKIIDCYLLQCFNAAYTKQSIKKIIDLQKTIKCQLEILQKSQRLVKKMQYILKTEFIKKYVQQNFIQVINLIQINTQLFDCFTLFVNIPSEILSLKRCQVQHLGYSYHPKWKFTPVFLTKESVCNHQTIQKNKIQQLISEIIKIIVTENIFPQSKEFILLNSLIPIHSFNLDLVLSITALDELKINGQKNKYLNNSMQFFIKAKQPLKLITRQIEQTVAQNINMFNKQIELSLNTQGLNCLIGKKMVNPHKYVKVVNKQKHAVYLAKGEYQYYHYGDNNFMDHGWGCAYRSLQTVLSWMNLQKYLPLDKIPSIVEIQEIIDKIDYNRKLKGTNEWIGVTQVSWVIKNLTDIDCRILHTANGKDIIQHCEAFREHFQRVGCPIMFGGGEYAYCIVGINYSWKLGNCEFLILDPHYTGKDLIDKVIQSKGVSWKTHSQIFKKGIFYNFCLPIVK